MKAALLALEDGRVFRGCCFGASTDAAGEVVFNTSMTGYQEILTDPSYAGQIVVLTYPLIGNYGIAPEDSESRRAWPAGLIVKEPSRLASNWRHERTLEAFLAENGVTGLCDLDTRALVRHLRTHGTMRGVIAGTELGAEALVARARALPSMAGLDLASSVSEQRSYKWERPSPSISADGGQVPPTRDFHVVVYDFGVKRGILRRLVDVGCRLTVVPATTPAKDVLALEPDGVLLSNGPGDPEPLQYAIDNTRQLLGRVPIFGICLGFQLLGLACGGRTYKMKFGHRGGNHPVSDMRTGRVEITSHNHGFAVDPSSLPADRVELTHVDLNDQTLEGFRLRNEPAFGVQYHPEAAPGPHDAAAMFERFTALMLEVRKTRKPRSAPARGRLASGEPV